MTYVKYPRTMHLPWSPGLQNDDRLIETLDFLRPCDVVITEKMDGENTTMYHDHLHARSLDSRHHPSRDWIKAFHGGIKHFIEPGMRICGENVYARHSIAYENLDTYFYGFSAWEGDYCHSWEHTLDIFDELGIKSVPVLFEGSYKQAEEWMKSFQPTPDIEGYVVRNRDGFGIENFGWYVAKYVRKDHIQTTAHWMSGPVIPNKLKE